MAGYPVLNALSRFGELTQKQMTRLLQVEQSSIAQLLGRLERDGFVERRIDPADRRSSLVKLTQKAIDALPAIAEVMNSGNDLAVAGMTDDEIDIAIDLLRRMIGNFEVLEAKK